MVGYDPAQQRVDDVDLIYRRADAFVETMLPGHEGPALFADKNAPALQEGTFHQVFVREDHEYRLAFF